MGMKNKIDFFKIGELVKCYFATLYVVIYQTFRDWSPYNVIDWCKRHGCVSTYMVVMLYCRKLFIAKMLNVHFISFKKVKKKRFKKIDWIQSHHLHLQSRFKLLLWWESLLEVILIRHNIAGWCQKSFCFQKFVDNVSQCFVFTHWANFPTHILSFHWRWRWWDWIQATL